MVERTGRAPTAGDDGHQRIGTDILFGRLRPGDAVRLGAPTVVYGVSICKLRGWPSRLFSTTLILAERGQHAAHARIVRAPHIEERAGGALASNKRG